MTHKTDMTNTQRPQAHTPVGVGFRAAHYDALFTAHTDTPKLCAHIGWLEVHPENYFGGGVHKHALKRARALYPISFHATGLSLGADQPVCTTHLDQIKQLSDEITPFQISDHASWSKSGNAHLNDLLPLPYTEDTLDRLCRNIDQTQEHLGRTILLENPSSYLDFNINTMRESTFMNRAAQRTGCDILLDVNNIYVQAENHQFDPYAYLAEITPSKVKEIHLAGHIRHETDTRPLLIDTHNRPIADPVWALYEQALTRFGAVPTLIEWDQDMPSFATLIDEAKKAHTLLTHHTHPQDSLDRSGDPTPAETEKTAHTQPLQAES